MPTRLILDTDNGTDVDDCLALAVILGSPELQLEGVTCVYGDVALRARMVLKLLKLAECAGVPVMTGASETLLGLRQIFWPGHEGQGLLDTDDYALEPAPEHAVDYLVRTVMENPGEMHLLAVGPLTNVALTFRREPAMVKHLAHLTIMGGAIRGPKSLHLRVAEHNFLCDPEAAHVVLSAGAPTTLVPLDVTTRVEIRREDIARIQAGGSAFHDAVADQVERYPRFAETGATYLHDPLAAAIIVQPGLVEFTHALIDIETEGRLTAGASIARAPSADQECNVAVALGVDTAAAEEFVLDRISKPLDQEGLSA
ncbi:MAG: nucleoside hydrolase [Thermomicrobiales bacterium]